MADQIDRFRRRADKTTERAARRQALPVRRHPASVVAVEPGAATLDAISGRTQCARLSMSGEPKVAAPTWHFSVHVSERLLDIHDGPFLELGLKGIDGTAIRLPHRTQDLPDRDRLAARFEEFRRAE